MTQEEMLELARKTIEEMPGFIKHNNSFLAAKYDFLHYTFVA